VGESDSEKIEDEKVEIEGEDEGEDEIENEGEVKIVVKNAVGPVGPAGPILAGPVGSAGLVLAGSVGPVGSALAPTIGSTGAAKSLVPAITVFPPTPVKNKGKSQVTLDDNQEDMLQDYPPDLDPDSLMGDNDEFQHKLKRGRERSGTGDARGIKTHRRSASHSTAPTVPSTEDDEVDPHGSSRSTGGFN